MITYQIYFLNMWNDGTIVYVIHKSINAKPIEARFFSSFNERKIYELRSYKHIGMVLLLWGCEYLLFYFWGVEK